MNTGPTATYVVVANDSLSGIAARADVSLDALIAANEWPEGADHVIFPGDVISLPPGASVAAAAAGPADPTPSAQGTAAAPALAPAETAGAPEPTYAALPAGVVPADDFDQVAGPPSSRSPGDPIGAPLEDGRYYADQFALSADGQSVEFTLARFFTTEECLARNSIAPSDADNAAGCFGYEVDTTSTAQVSMPVSGGGEALVALHAGSPPDGSYYWYVATSEELGELLAGTGPSWGELWIRGGAFVHLAGGEVVRVDITLIGS